MGVRLNKDQWGMSHSPTRASCARRPVAFVPRVQESVVVNDIDVLRWLGVAPTTA